MNTRYIAEEYRMSHWAGIIKERQESGLSIKEFCKNAGCHANSYYYWQRKLRDAACEELAKIQGSTTNLAHPGFTEVKLSNHTALPSATIALEKQICIEAARVRIIAGGEYPVDKLAVLLREVMQPC